MAYHAQGTLGDLWVTLWDPQTTFLVLHGEPESMFFEADFCLTSSPLDVAKHSIMTGSLRGAQNHP